MVDEDALNMQIRKFLKRVGVTSQREIDQALGRAMEKGTVQGTERLPMTMTLKIDGLELTHVIDGELDLSRSPQE